MSSIQRDRKAENNQGNNQIVNITLGEKITKEIKQEAIPVALPVDEEDDENDELVEELEEIIIKFDEIKDDIIAMGIPIPKRLSKIPDDISDINSIEDIKKLIKEITFRIKELERIKLRPKRETAQQAGQKCDLSAASPTWFLVKLRQTSEVWTSPCEPLISLRDTSAPSSCPLPCGLDR